MSGLVVYVLAGAAVVCIWALGLALCAAAARGDRQMAAQRPAQERAARDALRTQHNVTALPQRKPTDPTKS